MGPGSETGSASWPRGVACSERRKNTVRWPFFLEATGHGLNAGGMSIEYFFALGGGLNLPSVCFLLCF